MHFACEGQFAGFDIIDIGVTPDIVLTGLVKRILKSGFFIFDNKIYKTYCFVIIEKE